jgi:phosphatidylglycerol:prolipoprotein diacylglycerol transferase
MYPKILDVGPLTIHTYGLLLALAFIAGIWLASRNAAKSGLNPDSIWNLGLIIIFSALVGAKLLLFISDSSYYMENPREIFSLATLPSWRVADITAPGIALGQSIGRLGCLSAGCCYGKPTSMPWGITFTNTYSYENVGVPLNVPLHPTQIYESLGTFLLFGFLMWRLGRKHFTGQIILEYLMLYAGLRFVIEFFRDDERGFILNGLLSTSQFIGILTILGSALAFFYLRQRFSKAAEV